MRSKTGDLPIKVIVLIVARFGQTSAEKEEKTSFCQTQELTPRCRPNEVVIMTSSSYGRMEFGRCVDRDYGFIGCKADVLLQADGICSGRRSCSIAVPNALFETVPTDCPKDLKLYLEATYRCIPVVTTSEPLCSPGSSSLRLTAPSGYISNVFTEETELGSVRCPWLIQAGKGQRINVTLLDFSTGFGGPGVGGGGPLGDQAESAAKTCQAYATISERQTSRSVTVCSGTDRERHVFLSEQEQLEVRIQHGLNRNRTRYFLLKYEFVGCSDPDSLDRSVWNRRSSNQLDVGCSSTDRRWTLVCVGNSWSGPMGNCSTEHGWIEKFDEMKLTKSTIPWGVSIIAVSVIAVTLAIVILVAGLMILRCHRRSRLSDSLPEDVYYGEASKRQIPVGVPVSVAEYRPESAVVHRGNLENEYSYIGEMMDSASSSVLGRRSHDYGTTEVRCDRFAPPPPPAHYDPPCSTGEVEKIGLFRPSAYFELEPNCGAPRRGPLVDAVDLQGVRCYRQQEDGAPLPPPDYASNRYEGCGGGDARPFKAGKQGSAASVYFNDETKDLADNYKSV